MKEQNITVADLSITNGLIYLFMFIISVYILLIEVLFSRLLEFLFLKEYIVYHCEPCTSSARDYFVPRKAIPIGCFDVLLPQTR